MVGIVVVSHSQKLAEGVVELASLMAPETPMKAAGGMDDGGFGTSFERLQKLLMKFTVMMVQQSLWIWEVLS